MTLIKKDENYIFQYHNPYNIHANLEKIRHSNTLGIKLINLTVKQLGGECKVVQNEGLLFTITFKPPE